MREVGRVLCREYDGWFGAAVEAADRSAPALARLLAEQFPSFDDTAAYDGREVRLYKRAQILAADLYGIFGGRHWGELRDLDGLTAFADYKVPQILRAEGILSYAPALAARIAARERLPAESPEEVEIRACGLHVVELIVAARGAQVSAVAIDRLLWNRGQQRRYKARPRHRSRCTAY